MKLNGGPDWSLRESDVGRDESLSKPIRLEGLFSAKDSVGSSRDMEFGDNVLDREAMFAQVEGDMELFGELVELFLDSYPSQLKEIAEGISGHDPSRVREAAHSLKGALGNFQAATAVELANILELMGRDKNLVLAHQKLTELEAQMGLIRAELLALRVEVAA